MFLISFSTCSSVGVVNSDTRPVLFVQRLTRIPSTRSFLSGSCTRSSNCSLELEVRNRVWSIITHRSPTRAHLCRQRCLFRIWPGRKAAKITFLGSTTTKNRPALCSPRPAQEDQTHEPRPLRWAVVAVARDISSSNTASHSRKASCRTREKEGTRRPTRRLTSCRLLIATTSAVR